MTNYKVFDIILQDHFTDHKRHYKSKSYLFQNISWQ